MSQGLGSTRLQGVTDSSSSFSRLLSTSQEREKVSMITYGLQPFKKQSI